MDFNFIGIAIGLGLIIIGAGYGMSQVGGKAMEAMGRQPEAADKIRGAMLLAMTFIEGAAMFAIVLCLLMVFK